MAVLAPETLLPFPLGYAGINLLLDSGDTALILAGANDRRLLDFDPGSPEDQPQFAGSRDQDGDDSTGTRFANRQTSAKVRMYGDTDAELQTLVARVDAKLDKLRREGGELVATLPSGEAYILDVLAGTAKAEWGKRWVNHPRIDVEFTFTCSPFWREAEEELELTITQTSPCAIATAAPIRGSVPGLGRLVVESDTAADQAFVMWGIQSRHTDTDASAALFYEAEDLTPIGDAAVQTITGASGGDLVGCGDILVPDTWVGLLSTGVLSHVGDFRVWARIAGSVPDVCTASVALEWATGDFRSFTRNDQVVLNGLNGIFQLVDLGIVSIDADEPGWEGRIIVKSDPAPGTSDIVRVDCLFIMPVAEGYGEATGLQQTPTGIAMEAQDTFEQTSGNLTGKTLPSGQTWAGAGDTDDFTINTTDDTLDRDTQSDTEPRLAYVSGVDLTGCVVGVTGRQNFYVAGGGADTNEAGLIARYVDDDNYLAAYLTMTTAATLVARIVAVISGSPTVISEYTLQDTAFGYWRLILSVTPEGNATAQVQQAATLTSAYRTLVTLTAGHADLATGGALESGSVGIYDHQPYAATPTRAYDDFYAYEIPSDPAIFAGQNIEIRHDRVVREHEATAALTKVSRYAGDYLILPPAGSEDRQLRIIVKSSRTDPALDGADSGLDDLALRLFVTPRWLTIPGADT